MNSKFINKFRENRFVYISALVIIGAFIVSCTVGMLSEFGIHPDEYDVKACLDWCESRWIWPDMRLEGEGLGDTYSGYGFTKVCNNTPYFLIFSKISFIFRQFMHVLPYYRIPDLLLMLIMTVYIIKNLKRRNYMMLGFGIVVQAWYIFSYLTYDAEDYFLGFISMVMLADEESFLWKTLKREHKYAVPCVLLGVMYGVIMLSKWGYYAVLGMTFITLVTHLIKSEINIRKQLLVKYLIILGVAFAIFGARFSLDLYYYGFDKDSVSLEMEEKWCDYDKKPSTPIEEQQASWRIKSKGYPAGRVFELEPHWFLKTYRSFAGARITASGENIYYIVMAVLYAVIYVWIGISLCRSGDSVLFIGGTALNLLLIAASFTFSYEYEIQPQGRYLLPIALITCFLGGRARTIWRNRYFRFCVALAGCLSVAYYGLFESRKLIDLTYARSLLFSVNK